MRRNGLSLAKAAEIGHLITVRCNLCHDRSAFLASDLMPLFGPSRNVFELPFKCADCGKADYVDIDVRIPDQRDFGKLVIRRPAGVKTVRLWREVVLQ